ALLAWVGATAVTFWLIVTGAWVAVAAAGCVLAAGAGVAAGVPPQAARRALTALAPPRVAATCRNWRRRNRRGSGVTASSLMVRLSSRIGALRDRRASSG